jgi:acetyl-CoA acetyltransferase
MTQSSIVSTGLTDWTEAGTTEPTGIDRLLRAATSALEEAGMRASDLDAIICNTTALPFDEEQHITLSSQHFAHRLADQLGVYNAECLNVSAACASTAIALDTADAKIKTGSLDTVLVAGFDNSPEGFFYQGPSTLDTDRTVSYPLEAVGIPNPAYWGMWARRRAHDMGTSVEELKDVMATVKEIQSRNAANNPRARYTDEFSREAVLDSPVVVDPLHLYMICAISSGAGAAVVTSKETAREHTDQPVDLAASEVGSPVHSEPAPRLVHFSTAGGERADSPFVEWRQPIEAAYETAGITPDDLDIIECHDASSFHTLNWLDQILGWDPERTDQFVRDEEIDRDGELPVNLSGGSLSFGESVMSQGTMMLHELVTQLRGNAGERQALNAPETGLCTMYGAYGAYGAIILENGWE